jgi:zinc protease
MQERHAFSLSRTLLLAVLALAALRTDSRATSYAERVDERVLPNGLQLLLLEDHKAPVAVCQVWYRVGARNETPGKTGLSHLLEHMMFKGTSSFAPEDYSHIIQRNGGQLNAFTSQDYTTYFAMLASDRIHVVFELEADRMANLVVKDDLFGLERNVVKEERRLRTENEPVSDFFEQLSATAYVAHPYGQPVIGWMEDLNRLTTEDLRRYYKTYYVPNNAVVVVVGDFDASLLAAEIEAAFAPLPLGSLPPEVRTVEPSQRGERRLTLRRPAELPYVAIAYHTPGVRSRDAAPLAVLAEVLGGGRSARLHQELVYRRRLARGASAGYDYRSPDPTLFTVFAQPLPDKPVALVEQFLLDEIARMKRDGPTERELEKAKNGVEADFIFAQDSLFYQGLLLAEFEIAGDWRWIDEYVPAVRGVTAEDVLRVARFYLDSDNRTVGTLVPESRRSGTAPANPVPAGKVY